MPRIAFARVAQETNALSRVTTTLADFRRVHWLEGAALLEAAGPGGTEVQGFLRNAELSGFVRAFGSAPDVELVPLLSTWAVPGGPLDAATLEEVRARLVDAIRAAGPLDALYLAMHGAMSSVDEPDADGALLVAAREALGPDALLAVSFDLHAQLTPRKVEAVDVLTAYRTNPHRDHARVGERTGRILLSAARGEIRPRVAWRSLPMVRGGGTNIDLFPTMRPLFRRATELERDPRVLYASLFTCHLWQSSPEPGWATCVVTDGDEALGEACAEDLAERCWGVRDVPAPRFPEAAEAIARVRGAWVRRRLGTVCVCDASDIVGAGATGESTRLLRVLQEEAAGLLCYAPVRDAEVVAALWGSPPGTDVRVEVGGKLDPEQSGAPLPIEGRILLCRQTDGFGRVVVLEAGHLRLVVTEGPPLAMKPSFYADLGLSPWRADLVVVKSLFPFRLYFLLHNRLTLYARTRGITDLDAMASRKLASPVHPVVALADWREADRRRRGVLPTA